MVLEEDEGREMGSQREYGTELIEETASHIL
jgi:hypothetical protein